MYHHQPPVKLLFLLTELRLDGENWEYFFFAFIMFICQNKTVKSLFHIITPRVHDPNQNTNSQNFKYP